MLLSNAGSAAAFPQTPAAYEPPTVPTAYNFTINPNDPLSFGDVVAGIRAILGPSSGLDAADVDVSAIMALLRAYDAGSDAEAWGHYALADPSRGYTRNGVDECNSKANLLILVWNPGKGSLIHDHANAHCVMKILEGQLVETLYDWPEQVSDKLGLHRMTNPNPNARAVSLHLYTPPHAARFGCRIFNEQSGQASHVKMSTLFSNHGVRVNDSMTKGGDSC